MIDIFEEYIPICLAVRECKDIHGRKRFHKLFYLLKAAGEPIDEIFEWNNYGPFSKELANEIDSLCKLNLLEEYLNVTEYTYKLTDKGTALLDELLPKEPNKFKNFGRILTNLNKFGTYELEKLASIRFLIDEEYPWSYIITFLKHTKNYSEKEVEDGKNSIEELFKNISKDS